MPGQMSGDEVYDLTFGADVEEEVYHLTFGADVEGGGEPFKTRSG